MLTHADGIRISPALQTIYRNQLAHDPADINRAREIASSEDPIPVGILYRNPQVPCYEDLRGAGELRSAADIRGALEGEFDKFTVWPQ
jgi:2-oxoglutarate ferredoxin oxidoreductase subunit beta